jgi:hypothetical protein
VTPPTQSWRSTASAQNLSQTSPLPVAALTTEQTHAVMAPCRQHDQGELTVEGTNQARELIGSSHTRSSAGLDRASDVLRS